MRAPTLLTLFGLALIVWTSPSSAFAQIGPPPKRMNPPPTLVPIGPPPQPVIPKPVTPRPRPVARPLTIHEFARTVKPLPGRYEVLLCHPYTGKPVRVCFDLPQGCPKVIVRKKLFCYEIDFDYGKFEIELNFSRRGRVRVDYND